jgi:hypothetical protein
VQGFEVFRVRAIERVTTVTTLVHEADIAEHPQVLRNRGLRKAQRTDDVGHVALAGREIVQDVSTARFGDGVEDVRRDGGARHHKIIFLCGNMSSAGRRGPAPPSRDGTKAMYAQWRSLDDYETIRRDPRPVPYLREALTFAKFEPGICDVVESFAPPRDEG